MPRNYKCKYLSRTKISFKPNKIGFSSLREEEEEEHVRLVTSLLDYTRGKRALLSAPCVSVLGITSANS